MRFVCGSFFVAAVVSVTPVNALSSYLESLAGRAATTAPAKTIAPFFFTDGPSDDNSPPSFVVTNDASATGQSVKPATSSNYMDSLSNANTVMADVQPAAAGTSYLDALSGGGSGAASTQSAGPTMTNYLDALPQTSPSSSAAPGGSGMKSYASSLNGAAPLSTEVPAAPVTPSVPEASTAEAAVTSTSPPASFSYETESTTTSTAVKTSGPYLEALATGASSSVSGPGMTNYLDALPSTSTTTMTASGSGMTSYLDTMQAAASDNVNDDSVIAASSSTTVPDFTSTETYSGSISEPKPMFGIGNNNNDNKPQPGNFDLSLDANEEIVEQLKQAGNRGVTLSGFIRTE